MAEPTPDLVIAVWPCEHGNVVVEPGPAKPGYACHECGRAANTYILLAGDDFARWALVEKGELDARDERVLDLEAEVKRLEDREREAEQRVIAGEGSHQDTALVAIKLGEDLLEARTALAELEHAAREFTTAAEYAVAEQLEEELVAAMDAAAALTTDEALEGGTTRA